MSKEDIRLAAEADFETFIRLVYPKQVLGAVHSELIRWMEREGHKTHQLVLLPRDHQKSRIIAFRVAWYITRFPWIRVLYISSTANLAEKQLKFIKDILTSSIYRRYWPEMVNSDEGKREKWTNTEMSVDHPKRKEEGVRDPTVFTGGLTTNLVGMHCDIAVLDDTVTDETAYTNDGREKVLTQYSLLASIEGADSQEWAVGTRYQAKDLYSELAAMEADDYNEDGEKTGSQPVYEVFERVVEDNGDGTGTFLWPRQQRYDGKWFGFNKEILAQKRAKYLDRSKFRAQYYNDPNDRSEAVITTFQYYDPKYLSKNHGILFFKGNRLNVFASIDFAYSVSRKADYTALVVVGIDHLQNIYVLDIARIKTDRISDYFDIILQYHIKWDFRRLRAETTAAQRAIVKELKFNYLLPNGVSISIDESNPSRHKGSKEERMDAILEPRYTAGQIWHYVGGECQNLEEELISQRPAHDDIKDALASVIEICVPPVSSGSARHQQNNVVFHPRFGGVSL